MENFHEWKFSSEIETSKKCGSDVIQLRYRMYLDLSFDVLGCETIGLHIYTDGEDLNYWFPLFSLRVLVDIIMSP